MDDFCVSAPRKQAGCFPCLERACFFPESGITHIFTSKPLASIQFHFLPTAQPAEPTMPNPSSPGTVYPIPVSDEGAAAAYGKSRRVYLFCVFGLFPTLLC